RSWQFKQLAVCGQNDPDASRRLKYNVVLTQRRKTRVRRVGQSSRRERLTKFCRCHHLYNQKN
ncbi:MAG TPA: hypothetical protein VFZ23_12290, partial [Pyrinomonadaceae bacterium]